MNLINNTIANKIKVVTAELNYVNDGQESYAVYAPPIGYQLVNAFIINAPQGYLGVKLLKYETNGNRYTICLNWGHSGTWATRMFLVKP